MSRKNKSRREPVMPYGKFAGLTPRQILKAESSYLAWFEQTVEDEPEVKAAIRALPEFPEILVTYLRNKCLKARQAMPGNPVVVPDEAALDALCDRLFNGQA